MRASLDSGFVHDGKSVGKGEDDDLAVDYSTRTPVTKDVNFLASSPSSAFFQDTATHVTERERRQKMRQEENKRANKVREKREKNGEYGGGMGMRGTLSGMSTSIPPTATASTTTSSRPEEKGGQKDPEEKEEEIEKEEEQQQQSARERGNEEREEKNKGKRKRSESEEMEKEVLDLWLRRIEYGAEKEEARGRSSGLSISMEAIHFVDEKDGQEMHGNSEARQPGFKRPNHFVKACVVVVALSLLSALAFVLTAAGYIHVGVLCSFCATLFCHVLGILVVSGYKPYMPFYGGSEFVLLQLEGYFSIVGCMFIVLLFWWADYAPNRVFRYGLAAVQVLAVLITLSSLSAFKLKPMEPENKHGLFFQCGVWEPVGIAIITACFSQGHFVEGAVLFAGCAVCEMVFLLKRQNMKVSALARPWIGGRIFVILQAEGWLLCGMVIYGVLTIQFMGLQDLPGSAIGCSLLQAFSLILLATSVRKFDPNEPAFHTYVPSEPPCSCSRPSSPGNATPLSSSSSRLNSPRVSLIVGPPSVKGSHRNRLLPYGSLNGEKHMKESDDEEEEADVACTRERSISGVMIDRSVSSVAAGGLVERQSEETTSTSEETLLERPTSPILVGECSDPCFINRNQEKKEGMLINTVDQLAPSTQKRDTSHDNTISWVAARHHQDDHVHILVLIFGLCIMPQILCTFLGVGQSLYRPFGTWCPSRGLLLLPICAAPMVHTRWLLRIPSYKAMTLSGGFRSEILQTNGWICQIIAMLFSQADPIFHTPVLFPISVAAALCIGLAPYFHDGKSPQRQLPGIPISTYILGGISLFLSIAVLFDLTWATLAYIGLGVHFLLVAVGIHLMWTHWCILGGVLAYFTENEFLVSVFLVLVVFVNFSWYFCALLSLRPNTHLYKQQFLGYVALYGWSQWIGQIYHYALRPYFGKPSFLHPFEHCEKRTMVLSWRIYASFWAMDIGFHLTPCLWFFRFAPYVTPYSVIAAILLGQIWRRVVACRHLSLDWALFWTAHRVKWTRSEAPDDEQSLGHFERSYHAICSVYSIVNPNCPTVPSEELRKVLRLEYAAQFCMLTGSFFCKSEHLNFISDISRKLSWLYLTSIFACILGLFSFSYQVWMSWYRLPNL